MKYAEQFFNALASTPGGLETWNEFSSWASAPHQWAKMFINDWLSVDYTKFHTDMMRDIFDGLIGNVPEGKKRTAVISPRNRGKSHCARIVTLYYLTEAVAQGKVIPRFGTDFDFMYVGSTLDHAKHAFKPIVSELQHNERIQSQYGIRITRVEWGPPMALWLNNGMSLIVKATDSQLRGHHPNAAIFDDWQRDDQVTSDETRARFQHMWEYTVDQMFAPFRQWAVYLGNYMHLFDIYRHISLLDDTHTIIRPGMVEVDGKWESVWPQVHPTEDCLRQWKLHPERFETEVMNNPVINSGSPVKMSDIRYWDEKQMPSGFWKNFMRVTMGDPAARSDKRNCESAIVTVGWNANVREPDIYVLDARMGHWSLEGYIQQNQTVYELFRPHYQAMEDDVFAQALVLLSSLMQEKPHGFLLSGFPHDRYGNSKPDRLRSASIYTNHKRVYFKKDCPVQRRIIDQLVSYSWGDKFDGGDAYCNAVCELGVRYKPGTGLSGRRPRPVRDSFTGRVIGYQ